MDENKRAKIKRFLDDKEMSEAIRDIMIKSFLKPHGTEIQILAAERLAITLLDEAFKDLRKYVPEDKKTEDKLANVGL